LADPKLKLKLLEGIEKGRHTLTHSEEADISVDSLINDIDFNRNIDREEFAKLNEPIM